MCILVFGESCVLGPVVLRSSILLKREENSTKQKAMN